MMKSLFSFFTAASLRFRYVTIGLAIVVLIAGGVAISQLNQELLPPIEFPQTILLAQVSGMTSEQVVTVVTERLEAELATVPEIVNIESTTTGAFGSIVSAANDFGVRQDRLLVSIQEAVDRVWLPLRRIQPAEGQDGMAFANELLGEMTPEVLIYIAERDPNFLFQLSPEVWAALPDTTVSAVMGYLANEFEQAQGLNALQQLVDQEIIPQIEALELIGNVQISGGQALPGDDSALASEATASETTVSLLLQLSPEAWSVVAPKVGQGDTLNQAAVDALRSNAFTVPTTAPVLPDAWAVDHFTSATDLLEVRTLTTNAAGLFNNFLETGYIVGSLGQTDDLTPEVVTQLLEIEPSLAEYLEAEQLVALSPEVFAVLPEDYIAGLDGFTRDALAAAALAQSITGETVEVAPVALPNQWRINPPELVTFSFADLPLATFSVSSESPVQTADTEPTETPTETETETEDTGAAAANLVPLLSQLGNLFGGQDDSPVLGDAWNTLSDQPQFAGQSLTTAADLLEVSGGSASTILNTINAQVPEQFAGYEVRLLDSLTPETMAYLAENEPDFYTSLDAEVLRKLSPETLAALPEDFVSSLDAELATALAAIASGEQDSAFTALSALYTSNVPAADPDAPVLNEDWAFVGNFIGVELDTADDFFRFFPDATAFLNSLFDSAQGANFARGLFGGLSLDALQYMAGRDETLLDNLRVDALQLLQPDVLAALPQEVQDRAAAGGEPFVPTDTVTRTNGSSSLLVTVYKTGTANTVQAFYQVEEVIHEIQERNPDLIVDVAFEQASFIEKSIEGVAREGSLGALFAMVVILLFLSGGRWPRNPRRVAGLVMTGLCVLVLGLVIASGLEAAGGSFQLAFEQADVVVRFLLIAGIIIGIVITVFPGELPNPAWRATLVIGISIPLSIMITMIVMRWFTPAIHNVLEPLSENSPFFAFLLRLFPANMTLNIMTLSGLTVAIGRVVDDSIVVLENIFRQVQSGMDKREAILTGTRDVSSAIFVATLVTVIVFLPLGLTGGLIGEFFLPFGLAVTYALLASFIVAITVVPLLVLLFIRSEDEVEEVESVLEHAYVPVLKWSLVNRRNGFIVLAVAIASMLFGFVLFGGRPAAFLPDFGEPQIGVSVNMPPGTKIIETNDLALALEDRVRTIIPEDQLGTIQATVGGGGLSFESLLGGSSVNEAQASITVGLNGGQENLDAYAQEIRTAAEEIFGEENVSVSAASLSSQGFGGFAVVISGPQADLEAMDAKIIETISSVPGITNVTSNLAGFGAGGDAADSETPPTYIRIDGESALEYTGELETQNTIGVTQEAIAAINALTDLPDTLTVSQGFETETQVQGFQGMFVAMGISIFLMVIILVFTFGSPVYWLAIILSIVVAPVGAAVALTITNRVLGISALIGLLMLIGIVVTNAVVLIDRVHTNDVKRRMKLDEAIEEGGERRLRPIVMTAVATICALMPLAIGLSEGAIIASELGTVVIGGLFSSTLLTLFVVPVAYKLLHPIHDGLLNLVGMGSRRRAAPSPTGTD